VSALTRAVQEFNRFKDSTFPDSEKLIEKVQDGNPGREVVERFERVPSVVPVVSLLEQGGIDEA
jgi:hypothetical protein